MPKTPETLTIEESEKLLTTLRSSNSSSFNAWRHLRNYTIALLMLDAGLRVGEVVSLPICSLIVGNEPVSSLDMHGILAEKKCERLIPLSDRLKVALLECMKTFWNLRGMSISNWAFFDQHISNHISTRQVQRIIESASLSAFGRKIHPHVLRHTFATRLMRITSTPVVQQLLGHKHISSTQVYTHPNGDDCKKAIEALSKHSI
jgi:site-specific recombinase XerD